MNELLKRIIVNPAVMPNTLHSWNAGDGVHDSWFAGRWPSRDEVLKSYPDLEAADIDACLAYAAWKTQIALTPAV